MLWLKCWSAFVCKDFGCAVTVSITNLIKFFFKKLSKKIISRKSKMDAILSKNWHGQFFKKDKLSIHLADIDNYFEKLICKEPFEKKIFGAGSASEEVPFNPYFVCNTSNCVTVRPVRDHFTLKMNIAFFIRNLMPNIFFIRQFFRKQLRENRKKLFWGRIWQFFRERRHLTPKIKITFLSQMRYRIFYYLPIFSKSA